MIIVDDIEQGTPEWFAMKCGIPSSSHFKDIVTSKGEPSKSADAYLYRLAAERISGIVENTFQSYAMEEGIVKEAEARRLYSFIKDTDVKEVAFVYKDESKTIGASTDGLPDDCVLEIKCPIGKTHVEYLIKNRIPPVYYQQVQGEIYVTGRDYCDFMSYYPGMPPLIIRSYPDPKFIPRLASALREFVQRLDELTEEIRRKNG